MTFLKNKSNIVIIGKLLLYQMNKTLWKVLLVEINQLRVVTVTLLCVGPHRYTVIEYFPITACPLVFYSLHIYIVTSQKEN